jgi:hypothetical protein
MRASMLLVLAFLVSFVGSEATFAQAVSRGPDRMVQVVGYVPTRQELVRLESAGIDFLFVSVGAYPDRFQTMDLASYTGNLTLLVTSAAAPDSLQAIALNNLKVPVYLFLSRVPDIYGINRLAELKGDLKLYIMPGAYPGGTDVSNLNRIPRPYTLSITGAFPDTYASDRLNGLSTSTKLILNTSAYPDQFTVRNTNRITRPTTLFINKASSPGSSTEAGYLSMLNANFSVIIGRAFTAQMVLDRLISALVGR